MFDIPNDQCRIEFETGDDGEQYQVRIGRAVITPEEAKEIVEKWGGPPLNRVLNKDTVNQYARDMLTGKWNDSNSGVIWFSKSGELRGGQKRLAAVLASGIPREFEFRFGRPENTWESDDQVQPRTLASIAKQKGIAKPSHATAAAKQLWTILYSATGTLDKIQPSNAEGMELLLEHPDLATYLSLAAKVRRNIFRTSRIYITRPDVLLATMFYLYDKTHGDQALTMFKNIGSNTYNTDKDKKTNARNILVAKLQKENDENYKKDTDVSKKNKPNNFPTNKVMFWIHDIWDHYWESEVLEGKLKTWIDSPASELLIQHAIRNIQEMARNIHDQIKGEAQDYDTYTHIDIDDFVLNVNTKENKKGE